MRFFRIGLTACVAFFCTAPLAWCAPPAQQWFTVLLDGRKIGSFESTRDATGANVVSTQKLDIALERAGTRVALSSAESNTETRDGKPLAFSSVSRLSGSETRIDGSVHGDSIDIATSTGGGAVQHRKMPWPKGAVMSEGARLVGQRAGLKPGTTFTVSTFQPSSLDAAAVDSTVGTAEQVDLPLGDMRLTPVAQTINFAGAPMQNRAWIDADQTIHKLTMPVMGVELTLLACDRACAVAPNQDSDVFDRTLVASPRALTPNERQGALRFTLAAKNGDAKLALPDTDEQHVEHDGTRIMVTVRREAQIRQEARPGRDDRVANDWLQSRAPEVAALGKRAIAGARDPEQRMQNIENFVRGFIRNKSLGVGYASALEVARNPEGDCTEHAVLVAALGRSVGIATRVVDGLVYTSEFAGKQQVFVPHAWAQAWVDRRWQSFDAALNGFDSGHIALAVGDGDPWRFYSGLDLLGRIDVQNVDPVTPAR